MKNNNFLAIIIFIFCVSGCSLPFISRFIEKPQKSTGFNATVAKTEHINKGGKLLLLPFNAGSDTVSNEYFDLVAIWVIRGIYDVFEPGNSERIFGIEELDSDFFEDGKEVKYCFTADEELGKAYCYAIDEEGQLIADGNNTIKEIELSGKVVITKE